MSESEDYKRGYQDGFSAAKRPHAIPTPNLDWGFSISTNT